MRDATFYASGLLELDKLTSPTERRASWRQSMAALARATIDEGPGPLEGLHPNALVAGVRAALGAGLVDDLDWLAPDAAGAALYELASALPLGPDQRELGRRVLACLMTASAKTFVVIARRMALAGGRGLANPAVRVRVALVTELPVSAGVSDGPLALALLSRRESAREWIATPSTGSLPSRRLAARLLERAALEAALRAAQGDEHALRVFGSETISGAWDRLLADRESLVWRHVAVARGLLAPWVARFEQEIEQATAPTLSPTEWRRAAASLSALVGVSRERGLQAATAAISGGLLRRDPGAAAAFIWGLPRASQIEPEAAMQLVELVLEGATADVGEAVLDLRAELGDAPVTQRAAARALALVSDTLRGGGDDGAAALALEVARDLDAAASQGDESIRATIGRALRAYAAEGAKEAFARAKDGLLAARSSVEALEGVSHEEDAAEGRAGSLARRTTLATLRDLDMSLLEHDALALCLSLADAPKNIEGVLDGLRDRLADWILEREATPLSKGLQAVVVPPHPTLSMRRLRALLHLVDGDLGDGPGDPVRGAHLRKRCMRIARALLDRFERGPASPVRRTIIAALARALDALVRLDACDPVDALLLVSRHAVDPIDLATLGEASMDPDLVHIMHRYARFAEAVKRDAQGALSDFDALVRELTLDDSSRSEALRTVLLRVGEALGAVASAPSLRALTLAGGTEPQIISSLEVALSSLSQLSLGARCRIDPERAAVIPPGARRPLTVAVARVLSGNDRSLAEPVVAASLDALLIGIPAAIGQLVSAVVWKMIDLPREGRHSDARGLRMSDALPAWLMPRRSIGGFHVVRSLGAGATGSVFVATRLEEKGSEGAELFALKVPEYSAAVARSLSEAEFLTMFREEAAALITVPPHPNLARFVLFDERSKPKPILVMELVEGTTLEQLVESGALDTSRALKILDDVLRGLEAMHEAGVGHLDLKPSNVVLRKGVQAVLVDFGLSGRRIRPGCATGPYGAPEVWGADGSVSDLSPSKADVYAFACVAFEALTGHVLFDANTEAAQIAMHLAHDGFPPALRSLASRHELGALAELMFSTLRKDPRERPSAASVRKELGRLSPELAQLPWPIDAR